MTSDSLDTALRQPKQRHSFENYLFSQFCEDLSLLRQKKHNTSLHIAVIVKRGKILAQAMNTLGTRSSGSGFSNMTIHAEKAAVKKLGDTQKLRGADLYVFRVGIPNCRNSKPCRSCEAFLQKCMDDYGLRFVFYSTWVTDSHKRRLKTRRKWCFDQYLINFFSAYLNFLKETLSNNRWSHPY